MGPQKADSLGLTTLQYLTVISEPAGTTDTLTGRNPEDAIQGQLCRYLVYDLRSVPRLLPTHSQDKLPGLNVQPLTQTEDGQGTWGLHMLGKCPTTRLYRVTSTKVESTWHPKNTLIWGFNPQSPISTVLSRWKLKPRWYVEAGR